MLSRLVQDTTLANVQSSTIASISPGLRYRNAHDVTNVNFEKILAGTLMKSDYTGEHKLQSFIWCKEISISVLKSNQTDTKGETENHIPILVHLGSSSGDQMLSQQTVNYYKGFDSLVKQMIMMWKINHNCNFQLTSLSGTSRLLIEMIGIQNFPGLYLIDSPVQLRIPTADAAASAPTLNPSQSSSSQVIQNKEKKIVQSLPLILLRFSHSNQPNNINGAEELFATEEEIQCGISILNFNQKRLAAALLLQPNPDMQNGDSSFLSFLLPVARRCTEDGIPVLQACKLCISCRTFYGKFKCEICRRARYCSETCQKSDWIDHEDLCIELVNRKMKAKKENMSSLDDTALRGARLVMRNPKKIVNKKVIDLTSKDIERTMRALIEDRVDNPLLGLEISFCGRWTSLLPDRSVPKGVSINIESADVLLIELIKRGATREVFWLVTESVVDNYSSADSRIVGYAINNFYIRRKGARPWQQKIPQDFAIPLFDPRDKSEERWQQVQRSSYEKKLKPGKELTEWSYVQGWIKSAMDIYSSGK